jgi:hypothetical protein
MFQFDTKLFPLQLLLLKTDVYFLTIKKKRYFIREKNSRVQELNFMRVIVTSAMPYRRK